MKVIDDESLTDKLEQTDTVIHKLTSEKVSLKKKAVYLKEKLNRKNRLVDDSKLKEFEDLKKEILF